MESKKRIWKIKINDEQYDIGHDGNIPVICFVGYNNGVKARKKELYYSQRTKDNDCYDIHFEPCPDHISYSFFLGFFEDAIQLLINEHSEQKITSIALKKLLVKEFNQKYNIVIPGNDDLESALKDYTDALIEEMIDSLKR